MAKKKYAVPVRIVSSAQALEESHKLPSYWSHDGLLSQRILIHMVELLEEQNALLSLLAHRSPPNMSLKRTRPKAELRKRGRWAVVAEFFGIRKSGRAA